MKKIVFIIPLLLLLLTGCNIKTATQITRDGKVVVLDGLNVNFISSTKEENEVYSYTLKINVENTSDEEVDVVVENITYSFFTKHDVTFDIENNKLSSGESTIVTFYCDADLDEKIELGNFFFDLNEIHLILYLEDFEMVS